MNKNLNINKIFSLLSKRKSKQVISLFTSMVFGVFLGIGISLVNTRALGKELYGDFKFIQSFFSFVVTFITLGLYYTSSRLIAQNKFSQLKSKIVGAVFATTVIISIIVTFLIFVFSYYQDNLFSNELGYVFRVISIMTLILPLQLFVENILQGDNRIYELSIFRMGPKISYIIIALLLYYLLGLSITIALVVHFLTIGVFVFWALLKFKISFADYKHTIQFIWAENKKYGLQVYIGAITGVATAHLGAISIGFFMENTMVGFYSLAITATMPLSLLPSTIGITFFKDFANMKSIPVKVVFVTILLSVASLVGFMVLIKPLVVLLYTREYIQVVPFANILAVGAIFHGIGDFINRFLGAHGLGKAIRNSNFIIGIINVLGYYLLVKYFGAYGATITRVLAGISYMLVMLYYYRVVIKVKLNKE